MAEMTVSVSQGRVAFLHDARITHPDNAKKSMQSYNKNFCICDDIEKRFNDIFRQSVDEYNFTQKRVDRKINNYYRAISKSDRKEKVAYEYVFQIGNMNDNPVTVKKDGKIYWGKNAQKSADILTKFAQEFEQSNQNFKVISSTLHMDEKTPHLHIAFIPIANGYKNGLKQRDSLTKALKQMGYTNSKSNLAITQWQNAQKERLEELMRELNIERKYGSGRTERVAISLYKEICSEADMEREELQKQCELLKERVRTLQDRGISAQTLLNKTKNELNAINDTVQDKTAYLSDIEGQIATAIEKYNKAMRLTKLAESQLNAVTEQQRKENHEWEQDFMNVASSILQTLDDKQIDILESSMPNETADMLEHVFKNVKLI